MKRHFLLDENVLVHAVRGVDEHNRPDYTAAHLFLLIARNCHTVILNEFLRGRYMGQIKVLENVKSRVLEPLFVLKQLTTIGKKVVLQTENPPSLPERSGIPAEDVDVVRAALVSRPIFVTADRKLREAINACEALHLPAVSPREAVKLAEQS